jgi:hypothetical protein
MLPEASDRSRRRTPRAWCRPARIGQDLSHVGRVSTVWLMRHPARARDPAGMVTSAVTADQLLEGLWQSKGTDLLLCPTAPPMVRIDGDLQPMAEWGRLADHDGH